MRTKMPGDKKPVIILIHLSCILCMVMPATLGIVSPGFARASELPQIRNLKKNAAQISPELMMQKERQGQLYRLAQSYLQAGQYQNAIPILENLYSTNPENRSYYRALLSTYLSIGEFGKANNTISEMEIKSPNDPHIRIDRGNLLYHSGEKEQAISLWKNILKDHPGNLNLYSNVASAMIENRLFDEAIKVYEEAIRENSNASFLYQNIANLYQTRLMYAQSAVYYLKYLEANPVQQQYVFNRILSFQIDEEQRPDFFNKLSEIADESKHPEVIEMLIAQLYQRYREFGNAFEIYKKLETKGGSGVYLLQFARQAEQDSSYQIALNAYQLVIDHFPKSPNLIQAYQGAISTLFSLAKETGDNQYADKGLAIIDQLQTRYPQTQQISQIMYLKGIFYLDYFFDVDKAAKVFKGIRDSRSSPQNMQDMAALKLGECSIIRGNLPDAITVFQGIKTKPFVGESLLMQANSYYYSGEWDKAKETVQKIIQQEGLKSTVTNDALDLQMRLGLYQSNPEMAGILASADLLIFQRRKSEAIKKLEEVAAMSSIPPLVKAQTFQKMADLSLQLGEYSDAMDFCSKAIRDSSLTNYADQSLFLLGSILDKHLNKQTEAFEVYRKLLEQYPNSLFVDQARERMRKIREMKPKELP